MTKATFLSKGFVASTSSFSGGEKATIEPNRSRAQMRPKQRARPKGTDRTPLLLKSQ